MKFHFSNYPHLWRRLIAVDFLSIEWNSIRLGGPAHGIVIKTVHKTLPWGGGGPGGGWVGGVGVVGVQGVGGYLVVGVHWVGGVGGGGGPGVDG